MRLKSLGTMCLAGAVAGTAVMCHGHVQAQAQAKSPVAVDRIQASGLAAHVKFLADDLLEDAPPPRAAATWPPATSRRSSNCSASSPEASPRRADRAGRMGRPGRA